jgi:hypothetical protein
MPNLNFAELILANEEEGLHFATRSLSSSEAKGSDLSLSKAKE